MPVIKQQVAVVLELEIVAITCGECGLVHGLNRDFIAARRRDGQTWYCPNGHARVYRPSDLDEAREALAQERARAAKLLADVDRLAADVAVKRKTITALEREAKRVGDRIHAGVCPHCNRTFQNLARHMTTKHPKEVKRGG